MYQNSCQSLILPPHLRVGLVRIKMPLLISSPCKSFDSCTTLQGIMAKTACLLTYKRWLPRGCSSGSSPHMFEGRSSNSHRIFEDFCKCALPHQHPKNFQESLRCSLNISEHCRDTCDLRSQAQGCPQELSPVETSMFVGPSKLVGSPIIKKIQRFANVPRIRRPPC